MPLSILDEGVNIATHEVDWNAKFPTRISVKIKLLSVTCYVKFKALYGRLSDK